MINIFSKLFLQKEHLNIHKNELLILTSLEDTLFLCE